MNANICAAAAVLLLAAGCGTTRTTEWGDDPVPAGEAVLTVHGLSCPLCSNNLDGQLKRLEGVESVAIDLRTGEVAVTLGGHVPTTRRQLARAVEAAGFTLAGIEQAGNGE